MFLDESLLRLKTVTLDNINQITKKVKELLIYFTNSNVYSTVICYKDNFKIA